MEALFSDFFRKYKVFSHFQQYFCSSYFSIKETNLFRSLCHSSVVSAGSRDQFWNFLGENRYFPKLNQNISCVTREVGGQPRHEKIDFICMSIMIVTHNRPRPLNYLELKVIKMQIINHNQIQTIFFLFCIYSSSRVSDILTSDNIYFFKLYSVRSRITSTNSGSRISRRRSTRTSVSLHNTGVITRSHPCDARNSISPRSITRSGSF